MLTSSANSSPAASYDHALAHAVELALARDAPNFRDVLGAVDGADPPSVLSVLEHIAPTGHPRALAAQAAIAEARMRLADTPTPLPISHPLDYAWMFARPTQVELLQRIAAMTAPGDLVAHLGTPTLHSRATRVLPNRRHVLFDRDQRRTDAANALACESGHKIDLLQQTPPALGATLAVADPPWYTHLAIAFTHAASVLLQPGGQLLLSFGAALTRPGILADREEVVMAGERDGMSLLSVEPNAVRYATPAFERSAMIARGIPGTPADWRVGDLLSLQRTSQPTHSRHDAHKQDWLAVEIDSIPLRARACAPASGDRLIGRLVDGDILASVSGRAPEREHAALWTSHNRVYRSADPSALASVLQDLAGGMALPRDPDLERAAAMIAEIVALERREHRLPTRKLAVAT